MNRIKNDSLENTVNPDINNINEMLFVDEAIKELDLEDFTLISPDVESKIKILSLTKHLKDNDKEVQFIESELIKHLGIESLKGKDCVIYNESCDDCKNFIKLAKTLKEKGARNVILMITSGVFSKGFDSILEYVDQIVTTNLHVSLDLQTDFSVTVIGLDRILSYT